MIAVSSYSCYHVLSCACMLMRYIILLVDKIIIKFTGSINNVFERKIVYIFSMALLINA